MMTNPFYEKVRQDIQDQLSAAGYKAKVTLETVTNHNDVELVGVRVVYETRPMARIRYLNEEYSAYREGRPYQEILTEIYEQLKREPAGKVGKTTEWSYEQIRSHLYIQISEVGRNQKWLGDKVHEINGDMVLTYHALLDDEFGMRSELCITKTQIESWGVTEETIRNDARANLDCSEAVVNSMVDVVVSYAGPGEVKNLYRLPPKCWERGEPTMYILQNPERQYGASQLLRPEVLSRIGETLGDYYVLPSSVHEVLLIPKSDAPPLSALSQMVFEINRTEVREADILSDQVLYYDHDRELLMNAAAYFARVLGVPKESIDPGLPQKEVIFCDRDRPEDR